MARLKLTEILKESHTMQDAFTELKGMEILIRTDLGLSYIPVSAKSEFVILENNGGDREQFLHPYGSNVAYSVYNSNPEKH